MTFLIFVKLGSGMCHAFRTTDKILSHVNGIIKCRTKLLIARQLTRPRNTMSRLFGAAQMVQCLFKKPNDRDISGVQR